MLDWLIHKAISSWSRSYNYDATYLHEIADVSSAAALRFMGLPLLSQMQQPSPALWAGAALGSVLDGDCGPCAQLIVDDAVRAGVDTGLLHACLAGRYDEAGPVGLGFRFAVAAMADTSDLDSTREEIERTYGQLAVISVSYAAASCRAYPVLKRGLGHGALCQKIELDGASLNVAGRLGRVNTIEPEAT